MRLQIEIVRKALGCCATFSNISGGFRKMATEDQNPSAPVRVSDPEKRQPSVDGRV